MQGVKCDVYEDPLDIIVGELQKGSINEEYNSSKFSSQFSSVPMQ